MSNKRGDFAVSIFDLDLDGTKVNQLLAAKDLSSKKNVRLITSNPCFEIWLLLHVVEHKTALNSDAVIMALKKSAPVWKNYIKSTFTETQKAFLNDNINIAVARAKELQEFQNPSTGVYKLIEHLKSDTHK